MSYRLLRPIRETPDDYEAIEKRILRVLKARIYAPLIRELGQPVAVLKNSTEDLITAIQDGRLTFYRGTFSGRLNSVLTVELRKIGAVWDGKQGRFAILQERLPIHIRQAIAVSEARFEQKMRLVDQKLASIVPEEIAGDVKLEDLFDSTIWRVERKVQASIKNITIAPSLDRAESARMAAEYEKTVQLEIKEWTIKATQELRANMLAHAMEGHRYESAVSMIRQSYDVSVNKAKFLARQETSLLMTKFKQIRYQSAGVQEYKWKCVIGAPNHPVRHWHKIHDGKVFRWDAPPQTDKQGNHKNPGQDYNCRCVAIPIVRF